MSRNALIALTHEPRANGTRHERVTRYTFDTLAIVTLTDAGDGTRCAIYEGVVLSALRPAIVVCTLLAIVMVIARILNGNNLARCGALRALAITADLRGERPRMDLD